MNSLANTTRARKWQGYNSWRAKHRELDRARRLEKAAAKQAAYVANYSVHKMNKGRLPAAWATITIRMRDGAKVKLRIGETCHGLTVSPTAAGRRVAAVLRNFQAALDCACMNAGQRAA